jgi:hypothetical protein
MILIKTNALTVMANMAYKTAIGRYFLQNQQADAMVCAFSHKRTAANVMVYVPHGDLATNDDV